MLVDSHCHLNYLDHPQQALQDALQRGVTACLCIGVEQASINTVMNLAQTNSGVWCSIGEHPGSCSADASWVEQHLEADKVVAVGEMGLDYHYERSPDKQAAQRQTFRQQMALAEAADLPVIIHTRSAESDTLSILRAFPEVRGVLHCFTESWEMAAAAIELGYYVSISGIVTFKNAQNVQHVAKQIPADRLLVETDAPWLAPVPHRGNQNQPAFVVDTVTYLAQLRQCDPAELMRQTSSNFYRLFSLADPAQTLSANSVSNNR